MPPKKRDGSMKVSDIAQTRDGSMQLSDIAQKRDD